MKQHSRFTVFLSRKKAWAKSGARIYSAEPSMYVWV